ncbi:hypothetical protein N7517_003465 [Penicillium concentricum]|uniref:Cytochrome P450 n=1 Tax=Penicillium concentricum TaxID=293559 RepID=A0A9W9VLY6_9EURO|nr:uncharacterized protein N7517_003465 [Penicillium concentricum]KAJ5385554.1 hypothetical protein N7517_003465 [Penicillium concentricum]
MTVAKELLDKRGRLYVDRPDFPVTQDVLSGGNRILLMKYSDRWRNLRKIMHQLLMAGNADTYKPFQDIESRALLWQYLHQPGNYYQHGARFANSVIFSVVFGRRTSMADKNTQLLFSTIDDFMESQTSPSATLIEHFPWCARNLPKLLQWYRPRAEKVFNKTIRVYAGFLDDLERRVKDGQDPKCFARDMSQLAGKYGFDDAQKYFCAGSIIEAGSDTTRNQINIMLAAAAKFPEWVEVAQRQLDAVCGAANRLPDFDDWEQLPYIIAVIKESLRWRPNMTASGMPRALIEDDTYGQYKFEKGTVFTYNNFGIMHDEKEFPDNETFKPERFINSELGEMLKGHLGFGAGRRLCPGWFLGTRNMFIAFSRLLYCFKFEQVPGQPIDCLRIDALAHDHAPFSIKITPRSPAHAELIKKECATVGKDLD